MVRAARFLLPAVLLATVAACGATKQLVNTQGYIADEELTAAIEPGVDNKESVVRTLGQPTIAAQWDDNIWYYLPRNTKQIAFARPVDRGEAFHHHARIADEFSADLLGQLLQRVLGHG